MNKNGLPKKYLKMIGTRQIASGPIFSQKNELPETEFDCLDVRKGTATFVDTTSFKNGKRPKFENPSFELLLKNNSMKRAQWTRPFPIKEINLLRDKNYEPVLG